MQVRDSEEAMALVRQVMEERCITNKMLSIRTGLSVSCVSNVRSGRTAWPRPATMFAIMDVLDIEMVLRRKNTTHSLTRVGGVVPAMHKGTV